MRHFFALLLATFAGFLVVFVSLAILESSSAFWLRLPSWAPILPLACYAGASIWVICRVFFCVNSRLAGR